MAPPPDTLTPELEQVFTDSLHAPDDELHRWLHGHDKEGALDLARAALDEAFARGYAHGVEESLEEALDRMRTVLACLLETKFGELGDDAVDLLGQADERTLERWCVAVIKATSVQDALRPPSNHPGTVNEWTADLDDDEPPTVRE